MPGELSRHHGAELSQEPEYIETNHEEQAIGEALRMARALSEKLRRGVSDPERQRALRRDLVGIIDNQLYGEILPNNPNAAWYGWRISNTFSQ